MFLNPKSIFSRSWMKYPNDVLAELSVLGFRSFALPFWTGVVAVVVGEALAAHDNHAKFLWGLAAAMACSGASLAFLVKWFNRQPVRKITLALARRGQHAYAAISFSFALEMAAGNFYFFRHHDQTGEFLSTLAIFAVFTLVQARMGFLPWIGDGCRLIMFGTLAVSVSISGMHRAFVMGAFVMLTAYILRQAEKDKFSMILEQLHGRRRLHELAETDPLTGIANRRQFLDKLAAACERRDDMAVFMIDLDQFKPVNDRHGHQIGDKLLQRVAERLKLFCKTDDIVARLGGDEFAILQRGALTEAAKTDLSQRMALAMSAPFVVDEKTIQIGASIGATTTLAEGYDPANLISHADAAMYEAKCKIERRVSASTEAA